MSKPLYLQLNTLLLKCCSAFFFKWNLLRCIIIIINHHFACAFHIDKFQFLCVLCSFSPILVLFSIYYCCILRYFDGLLLLFDVRCSDGCCCLFAAWSPSLSVLFFLLIKHKLSPWYLSRYRGPTQSLSPFSSLKMIGYVFIQSFHGCKFLS